MERLIKFMLALIGVIGIVVSAQAGNESDSTSSLMQIQEQKGAPTNKSTFFSKLRQLIDSEKLTDSITVGQILDLDFISSTIEQIQQPSDCKFNVRSSKRTIFSVIGKNWFHPTSAGVQNMKVPAAFINPAVTIGNPELVYIIIQYEYCKNKSGAKGGTAVTLSFNNLPSFLCISPGDVKELLPSAEYIMATDGVSSFEYEKKYNEVKHTLRLFYRMGAPCALAAEIKQ